MQVELCTSDGLPVSDLWSGGLVVARALGPASGYLVGPVPGRPEVSEGKEIAQSALCHHPHHRPLSSSAAVTLSPAAIAHCYHPLLSSAAITCSQCNLQVPTAAVPVRVSVALEVVIPMESTSDMCLEQAHTLVGGLLGISDRVGLQSTNV